MNCKVKYENGHLYVYETETCSECLQEFNLEECDVDSFLYIWYEIHVECPHCWEKVEIEGCFEADQ